MLACHTILSEFKFMASFQRHKIAGFYAFIVHKNWSKYGPPLMEWVCGVSKGITCHTIISTNSENFKVFPRNESESTWKLSLCSLRLHANFWQGLWLTDFEFKIIINPAMCPHKVNISEFNTGISWQSDKIFWSESGRGIFWNTLIFVTILLCINCTYGIPLRWSRCSTHTYSWE